MKTAGILLLASAALMITRGVRDRQGWPVMLGIAQAAIAVALLAVAAAQE